MPEDFTGDPVWRETITGPSNGDEATGLAVTDMGKLLADRTSYLYERDTPFGWIQVPLARLNTDVGGWTPSFLSDPFAGWIQSAVDGAYYLVFGCTTPEHGVITDVEIVLDGDLGSGGRGDMPATKPILRFFRSDHEAGAATQIGADVVDPSADLAAYNAAHRVNRTGLTEEVSRTRSYYIVVVGETGVGSEADQLVCTGARFNLTPPAP